MDKYETAVFAANYIWDTFLDPNEDKKDEVLDLLGDLITRKIDEKGIANFYFVSPGNIDLISKYCSQMAGVYNARFFDLRITKESVKDYKSDSVEPIFTAGGQKK